MGRNKALSTVLGVFKKYQDDRKKQIKELKKLIREGQNTGDVLLTGLSYCLSAEACCATDDLDNALENALKAVALLSETKEYEYLIKAHSILSYVYGVQENFQMTLKESDKAYELVRRHRIGGRSRVVALNNLANCYHTLGDFKMSIKLLTECLELTKKDYPERYSNLAMYSINLANNYKSDGNVAKAGEILSSMEPWVGKIGSRHLVCDYYLRSALICYGSENGEKGDKFVDLSLDSVPDDIYPIPLYDDFRKVSQILVKKGDRVRAGKVLDVMTVYAQKNKETIEQLVAVRMMADYYSGFGDTARAAEYYKELDGLYEKRIDELSGIKMNIYKGLKKAEAEIVRMKQKMQENEALYSLEPMTKLLNRSALLTVSAGFIEKAAKKKKKVGGIFIDIDFFKECNDTYGHARGDEIIKEVARVCKEEENANVRFARYGGDEFFGITYGLSDAEIKDIARRICRRIRDEKLPNEHNPNGRIITLSVGVVNVRINDRNHTIIEIANYADKAVYHAKGNGKNAAYLLDYAESGENGRTSSYIKIDFEGK